LETENRERGKEHELEGKRWVGNCK